MVWEWSEMVGDLFSKSLYDVECIMHMYIWCKSCIYIYDAYRAYMYMKYIVHICYDVYIYMMYIVHICLWCIYVYDEFHAYKHMVSFLEISDNFTTLIISTLEKQSGKAIRRIVVRETSVSRQHGNRIEDPWNPPDHYNTIGLRGLRWALRHSERGARGLGGDGASVWWSLGNTH